MRHVGGGIARSDLDQDADPVDADTDTDTNADVSTDSGLQRHCFCPSRFVVNSMRHTGGGIARSDLSRRCHDAAPLGADADIDTNVDVSTDSGLQRHGFRPSRFVVDSTGNAGGGNASSDLDQDDAPEDADTLTDTNADVNHYAVLTQSTSSNHINTTR